jgi:uncharacterized phage-associated protein
MAPWCRPLYREHRGQFKARSWSKGDPDKLTPTQRETIGAVLKYYGDRPSQWLSDLTHREAPWAEARQGLGPGEHGCQVISHASMAEYYESLI